MIIKSFVAETASAALKLVRTDMGGEAVVLKTRQFKDNAGGNHVEVTACLDNPTAEQADKSLAAVALPPPTEKIPPRINPEVFAEIPAAPIDTGCLAEIEQRLEHLVNLNELSSVFVPAETDCLGCTVARMRQADLPDEYIRSFVKKLQTERTSKDVTESAICDALTETVSALIEPATEFEYGDRILVAGPAGSGKTTLIGTLAYHLAGREQKKVRLYSLDSSKVAARDEIESYGELLGVPVADAVKDPGTDTIADEIILIDTASQPTAEQALEDFATEVEKANANYRFLVVSALTRYADLRTLVARAAGIDPTHLVVTMTDQTDRLGATIAVAQEYNLRIGLVTNSPGSTGMAEPPDAFTICARILGAEVADA